MKPYADTICQTRCNDIALLLQRGHFAAAKYLWNITDYTVKYLVRMGVAPQAIEVIEHHLKFLEE